MGKSKSGARRSGHPARRAEADRLRGARMDASMGPITNRGRVITPEIIAEMRAEGPGLSEEDERYILANNAPWINDPQLRQRTDELWAVARALTPDAFRDCGCGDH